MIWFLGDAANLAGSVWANLVPVVIAIACYFFFADFVFVGQCVYYNIKNARNRSVAGGKRPNRSFNAAASASAGGAASPIDPDPATPLLSRRLSENLDAVRRESRRASQIDDAMIDAIKATEPSNPWLQNLLVLLAICAVGTAGWTMAWQSGLWKPTSVSLPQEEPVDTPFGASLLGYFSSICYLGARLPQIYKNYCDKSCEVIFLQFRIYAPRTETTEATA
ncbi:hypothetical protein KEM54_003258 [Ascosphaera aggregata]|nr:hypothetical protein KEM54_003258 [Ascosphaera aggregata]